jgi:DNA-binding NarL/FixJ family response regulator
MPYEEEAHDRYKSKTGILIVDDHPIVRRGLMQLINQELDLAVCAEAENAEEALEALKTHQIDLAIVDISLVGTNGLKLTKKIKEEHPHLPILILTMHDEARYAESAFEAGARGYVTKQEAAETVVTAIRLVLGGQQYRSKTRAENLRGDTNYKTADCRTREYKS